MSTEKECPIKHLTNFIKELIGLCLDQASYQTRSKAPTGLMVNKLNRCSRSLDFSFNLMYGKCILNQWKMYTENTVFSRGRTENYPHSQSYSHAMLTHIHVHVSCMYVCIYNTLLGMHKTVHKHTYITLNAV